MANPAFYIGIIGGGLVLIFSLLWGPIYSVPAAPGEGDGELYYGLIILPPLLAMTGGLLINVMRPLGILLLVLAGIGTLLGYAFNLVSLFGMLYMYGGYSAYRTRRIRSARRRRRA